MIVLDLYREARDNTLRVLAVVSIYLYMLVICVLFGWVDIVKQAWAVVCLKGRRFPFIRFCKHYLGLGGTR